MNANLIRIRTDKKQYLDLLLLGDEQESMIDRYLERGEMFVLEDNGVKAVCVVTDEGGGTCGLKNIAVVPHAQRQGYGRCACTAEYIIGLEKSAFDKWFNGNMPDEEIKHRTHKSYEIVLKSAKGMG